MEKTNKLKDITRINQQVRLKKILLVSKFHITDLQNKTS